MVQRIRFRLLFYNLKDLIVYKNTSRNIYLYKIYEEVYNKAKESGLSNEFAKIKATNALYKANAFDYSEV